MIKKFQIPIIMVMALICVFNISARETIFSETFLSVNGHNTNYALANPANFDNPGDWQLSLAYDGDQCIVLDAGGSITLPPIEALTGNAVIEVQCGPHYIENNPPLWGIDPETASPEEMEYYYNSMLLPHTLSIAGGSLSTDEISEAVSMGEIMLWDVSPSSRITITASHPVDITAIKVFYGSSYQGGGDPGNNNFVIYSHEEKEYAEPISVTLDYRNLGEHSIPLYTIDGTDPVRTSPRYNGPIDISATTTIKPAYIDRTGIVILGNAATFTIAGGETTLEVPDNLISLNIPAPGKLTDLVLDLDAAKIEALKITGKLNSTDLAYIVSGRRLADLTYLDLSGITLDYDNGIYYDVVSSIQPGLYSQERYVLSEINSEQDTYLLDRTLTTYYSNNLGGLLRDKENITTVIWPENLTSVGVDAFTYCTNLSYFGAHDGLTGVDKRAFYYCNKLGNYKWIENLSEFGDMAFADARVGYKMEFGKNNVKFGDGTFARTNIREAKITFPSDTLSRNLFEDSQLEYIEIGDGCKVLDHGSLYTSNLTNVVLPPSIEDIKGSNNIFKSAFDSSCPFIRNLPIEDGIQYINTIAYNLPYYGVTDYIVKYGTTKLADGLFKDQYSLNSVQLPESLTTIGDFCFQFTTLKAINLPESLQYIGEGAFEYSQLENLTIPENVKYIGGGIVQDCSNLWKVTYNAIDAEGTDVLIRTRQGWVPNKIERIVIGDKVKRIPSGIFTNNQNITEVDLPASLELLDYQAFFYCKSLRKIEIPDNVSVIGELAFGYCDALADVHWPLNLKTIGEQAFRECYSLKNISMPEGTTYVGDMAFLNCKTVDRVYIPYTLTDICHAAFKFRNSDAGTVITCTATTPPEYQWIDAYAKNVKVPAASLQAYWDSPYWKIFTDVIIPIEDIRPITEETTTSFDNIGTDTDFSDGYVGDVYITLGEDDSYDQADGCIVLGSTMTDDKADAIGGLVPGESDIANRFDGLIVMVEAGHGTVTVDCQTIGGNHINVKIGADKPMSFTKDSKGNIEVEYNVDEASCIYIYGSSETPVVTSRSGSGCVRIYSITVNPISSGISDISAESNNSPIVSYYTISGKKISKPAAPGIYIIMREDGTTSKVLVK